MVGVTVAVRNGLGMHDVVAAHCRRVRTVTDVIGCMQLRDPYERTRC